MISSQVYHTHAQYTSLYRDPGCCNTHRYQDYATENIYCKIIVPVEVCVITVNSCQTYNLARLYHMHAQHESLSSLGIGKCINPYSEHFQWFMKQNQQYIAFLLQHIFDLGTQGMQYT